MKKTLLAIAAAAALASSSAWAQDGFPVTAQSPDSYCLSRGVPGTPLNSSCIDWIQRYSDIAKLYWQGRH